MKALLKTLVNLVYPDPTEPEPKWKTTDYIALVILALALAAVIGFWPE
jgi:hypothetical protein